MLTSGKYKFKGGKILHQSHPEIIIPYTNEDGAPAEARSNDRGVKYVNGIWV